MIENTLESDSLEYVDEGSRYVIFFVGKKERKNRAVWNVRINKAGRTLGRLYFEIVVKNL